MADQELMRPNVTVRQVLTTVEPQVETPALQAVVVGPCKQIVEPTLSTAAGAPLLNLEAQVALPASLQAKNATGSPPVYALSSRQVLCFSVNNKPEVQVPFLLAANYPPSSVVDAIKKAMAAIGESDAVAEVVDTSEFSSGRSFRIRTVAKDENQQIEIDPEGPAAPAEIMGSVDLTTLTYPGDVAGLTLIVSVDEGAPQTITLGSPANAPALLAALAAITGATAVAGPGDELVLQTDASGALARIEVTGGTLLSVVGLTAGQMGVGKGSSASLLSAFGFHTTDLEFGASKYAQHELIIPPAAFPDPRANLSSLVFETDTIRPFFNTTGSTLVEALRKEAPLRVGGAIAAVDDGDGDNTTPFLNAAGQNFLNPTPAVADVSGAGAPNFASLSNKTLVLSDGRAPRVVSFGTVSAIGDVVNAINAVFDVTNGLEALNDAGKLRLRSTRIREDVNELCKGEDSFIAILGGTAFSGSNNYLDTGVTPILKPGRFRGATPHKVAVGDRVYADGTLLGIVVKVAPSGVTSRLRISREVLTSFSATNFYIVATNLSAGDIHRPQPSALVEADGQVVLKPGLVRNARGEISESVVGTTLLPAKSNVFLGYTALRLDVSSRARGLLKIATVEQAEQLLAPLDERNPLGLGVQTALRASPRFPIAALGVDATSVNEPEGTLEAYERAAAHLEAFEVYSIALLTHSQAAAEVFQSHVQTLSLPENSHERKMVFCPKEPSRALDTLVAGGSDGNTVGAEGDCRLRFGGHGDRQLLAWRERRRLLQRRPAPNPPHLGGLRDPCTGGRADAAERGPGPGQGCRHLQGPRPELRFAAGVGGGPGRGRAAGQRTDAERARVLRGRGHRGHGGPAPRLAELHQLPHAGRERRQEDDGTLHRKAAGSDGVWRHLRPHPE